jgi:hypothetical protein
MKIFKKLKNWFRKRKKWQSTGANYISDYENMKKAAQDPNIIYLKPRGFGKTTVLNDLISEFETQTGSKLEDWQKEVTINSIGRQNKALYRNMRTGQIVHENEPIDSKDVVNMHSRAEMEADKPKYQCGIFADLMVVDGEIIDPKTLDNKMPKYPPNTPSREQILTDNEYIKTVNATDVEWITPEKLAEIKENSKQLSEFEWQQEYLADYRISESEEKEAKKKDGSDNNT